MTTNTARITTRKESTDGKTIRMTDAEIVSQFTSDKARKFWDDTVKAFPEGGNMPEPGRWGRNKAIQIENRFRSEGAKIKRPLLHRLHEKAVESNEDDEAAPAIRIDDLLVPVPKGNLKKWVENGFVEVVDSEEGQTFLKFTPAGETAAQEVDK